MSILQNNPVGFFSAGTSTSQYQIQRSLRFNSADSAYLSRTPASAGNRKTWTWSGWVKRAQIAGTNWIFSAGNIDTTQLRFTFLNTDALTVDDFASSAYQLQLITTQLFRDPSAWYHIVLSVDTTQATAADRVKLYVNGSQITTFSTSTYYSQNYDTQVNTASLPHRLGAAASTTAGSVSASLNAYLADIHFIDGQALTPSSFGETDATTGEWVPIAYTGTYGTNGFKLDFADNSAATAAALGKDTSGNGNNWTPNNLSVTAGAGNDSLVDTPTSYGTDTGVGGEVRGNYCTLNPLTGLLTLVNGNLEASTPPTTSQHYPGRGSIYVSSGKWYWEIQSPTVTAAVPMRIGIAGPAVTDSNDFSNDAQGYAYQNDGKKVNSGTSAVYGATYSNDIIGVALDLDAGTLVFYKNGVSQGTAYTGISGSFAPAISVFGNQTSGNTICNFGQRPFANAAPAGFKALCDTNLPAPTIVQQSTVMDVKLYTGSGATPQSISGLGFSPDLVWIKARNSSTFGHFLFDTVRGATKYLGSHSTAIEQTNANSLTSFDSSGFTVGTTTGVNNAGTTFAAWCWDAGSSTVTNTSGTIQSSVRANASAGFSIVTYTGTGANATVGHGLGVAPGFIFGKRRTSTTNDWIVYHVSTGANVRFGINQTNAPVTDNGPWNDVMPTGSVFTIGTASETNSSTQSYVMYCFAPVADYSAFGSYTGNGNADGPFVYTGFRPRWVMVKRTDTTGNWMVMDASRNPANVADNQLYPNLSNAEAGSSSSMDLTSNGFKLRNTGTDFNANAATYIYAAFAESPFQTSRAR